MTGPIIPPGTYRIQIGGHGQQALLTPGKSATVGQGLLVQSQAQALVDDPAQEWVLAYTPESDTYTVKSVSTGMYIVGEYPCVPDSNLRLSAKAQQWEFYQDPASPSGVVWFRVPKTEWTVHLRDNAPQNHRVVMWTIYNHVYPEQDCLFDPVANPAAASVYAPLITNPVILPGTYRIRSLSTKNLITLESTPNPPVTGYAGVCIVGKPETSGDPYQQWTITYVAPSRSFYLQSVATNKYITSVPLSYAGAYLIPGDMPQHWNIRQAEFDSPSNGLYAIHMPETAHLIDSEGSDPTPGHRLIIYDRPYPLLPQERWMFEPIAYPTGATFIGRPPVLVQPLLQGVYRLRNVGTNNLVTLPPAAKGPNLEDGPNLISNPDATDSDDALYQQWIVTYETRSQTYTIESVRTGTYITSTYLTSILQGGAKPQLWDIRQLEYDGQPESQLLIKLPSTPQCVTVWGNSPTPGTRVGLYNRSAQPADTSQRFIFEPVSNPSRLPNPVNPGLAFFSGPYVVQNVMSGTLLDLSGSATIDTATVGRKANGLSTQRWIINPSADGSGNYTIQNLGTGVFLASPTSLQPSAGILASSVPGNWSFNLVDGGSVFKITVPGTDWTLDLDNGKPDDGTRVQLWENNGGAQQEWRLTPATL